MASTKLARAEDDRGDDRGDDRKDSQGRDLVGSGHFKGRGGVHMAGGVRGRRAVEAVDAVKDKDSNIDACKAVAVNPCRLPLILGRDRDRGRKGLGNATVQINGRGIGHLAGNLEGMAY
jgi:hypothetical protein